MYKMPMKAPYGICTTLFESDGTQQYCEIVCNTTRVLHNVQSLHLSVLLLLNATHSQKKNCLCEGNLPPKHVKLIKSQKGRGDKF